MPVIVNELNVPTLVIFGWAAVVTVPAVVAEPAGVACGALATVPVTFAAVIVVNGAPLPTN